MGVAFDVVKKGQIICRQRRSNFFRRFRPVEQAVAAGKFAEAAPKLVLPRRKPEAKLGGRRMARVKTPQQRGADAGFGDARLPFRLGPAQPGLDIGGAREPRAAVAPENFERRLFLARVEDGKIAPAFAQLARRAVDDAFRLAGAGPRRAMAGFEIPRQIFQS